jgi:hypothetical protein
MSLWIARAAVDAAFTLALLAVPGAQALPMGSPGDTMVMLDVGADERELAANYALNGRFALGANTGRWQEEQPHGAMGPAPTHERERRFTALTSTHRLQRWNLPHAQANVWLVGQLGQVRGEGLVGTRTLASVSLMADYETTRVYLGGGWRPMRASGGLRHDTTWLRSGFSFYEAEYDAVQPWFILEAKQTRNAHSSETVLTPMLRFIHKRVFVEAGGNRKGAQVNLMLVL